MEKAGPVHRRLSKNLSLLFLISYFEIKRSKGQLTLEVYFSNAKTWKLKRNDIKISK